MNAYQLRVELLGIKQTVYRRFIVPEGITFKRLHDVIQAIMGWKNYHLFEFTFDGEKIKITSNYDQLEEYNYYKENLNQIKMNDHIERILNNPVKPVTQKIDKYLLQHKKVNYNYDFGDYWQHDIVLEKVVNDYPHGYPICIEYVGVCPPEDIGGTDGYAYFLDVIKDKDHPDYQFFIQHAEKMDYVDDEVSLEELNDCLKDNLRLKRIK